MNVVRRRVLVLAVALILIGVVCTLLGIWTTDHRWGDTSALFWVLGICAAAGFGLSYV